MNISDMLWNGMDHEEQVRRVRGICLALPRATEKLSHGEPAFFVNQRLFAMISNNHHNDGHVAVWVAAAPGEQQTLIANFPKIYYKPPYVGVKGWVGIELGQIDDEELGRHLTEAWELVGAPRRGSRLN